MAIPDYDPTGYNSLGSLNQALNRFDASDTQSLLDNEISDLFAHHDVASKFGIILLHRHFPLASNEILVEHGSTSTPWAVPPDPANFMGGRITPRSWYFTDDDDDEVATSTMKPYEYGFQRNADGGEDDPTAAHPLFMADLRALLKSRDMTSILGLTARPPDQLDDVENPDTLKCEKTFGRANIVFDLSKDVLGNKGERTSIWMFVKGLKPGQKAMWCISGCLCSAEEE